MTPAQPTPPAREPAADAAATSPADRRSAPTADAASGAAGNQPIGPWPRRTPRESDVPCAATLPGGRPWPRISLITPSYNQGRYIEDTILSVLHQRYPNTEHIVIDGGSTDETADVLDRYRDQLTFVVSEADAGQSAAINKGMTRATGEILTWLNSDDMLAPGALRAIALAFDRTRADLVAGICRVHRDGIVQRDHRTACADGPLPLDELLDVDHCWLAGNFFFQPEIMFTRALWHRAGGYVDESLYYCMDYELWLRFAECGARLHVIDEPICFFREHDEQKTRSVEQYRPVLLQIRDRFCERTGRDSSTASPDVT